MDNRRIKFLYDNSTGKYHMEWVDIVKNFEVLEQSVDVDGVTWYSVHVSDQVSEWLFKTFKKDVDFVYIHQLKGVWVDMPGKTLALLKLKWS